MVGASLFFIVLGFMVAASVSDVLRLKIPNVYSLIVIAAFGIAFLADPQLFGPLWQHLVAALVFFVITYILFHVGVMGGGDTKFGTALALWTGLHALMVYMVYLALMGGVLGVVALYIMKKKPARDPKPGSWVAKLQEDKSVVPYGVAISIGALGAFYHTGFLHQILDEVHSIFI